MANGLTGPWASEFDGVLAENLTPYERTVLSDGVITDQEYAETIARYRRCLSPFGIKLTPKSDGSAEFSFPPEMGSDAANKKDTECSKSSGDSTVDSLFTSMHRNPQNQDEDQITVACLVRERLVDPGYSVAKWIRDQKEATGPSSYASPRYKDVRRCERDPLGLLGDF